MPNIRMTTDLVPAWTDFSCAPTQWENTAIFSCDGYQTLNASFNWTDSYAMVNSSNFIINFYMDAEGKYPAGLTQWGSGTIDFSYNTVNIIGPYFSLSAKNTDTTTAHPCTAWAYLIGR